MVSLTGPKERGIVHIPILIAAIALIGFILVSSSAEFKDKLFSTLFPKPSSYAVSGPISGPIPPTSYPTPTPTTYTPKPTPSPIPTPTPISWCTACGADVNKSGGVDIVDYSYLVSCYNKSATDRNAIGLPCAPADINGNGIIDRDDFNCLTSKFGQKCSVSTPILAPQADLTVSSVQVLGTSRVRSKNSVNVIVRNNGTAMAKGKVSVNLAITQQNKTVLGKCTASFSNLAANTVTTVQARDCPAFKTFGTHTITATVDSTNVVAESNEKNNQLSTSINVN